LRTIALIGFDEPTTARLSSNLAAESCSVSCKSRTSEIPSEALALLVCGDHPKWQVTVREARWKRPDIRVVVVTCMPDTSRWLDALEAGAHDYCGVPLDRYLVTWLLGRDMHSPKERLWASSVTAA
jgi:ActR/RegA family two-component response regulator